MDQSFFGERQMRAITVIILPRRDYSSTCLLETNDGGNYDFSNPIEPRPDSITS